MRVHAGASLTSLVMRPRHHAQTVRSRRPHSLITHLSMPLLWGFLYLMLALLTGEARATPEDEEVNAVEAITDSHTPLYIQRLAAIVGEANVDDAPRILHTYLVSLRPGRRHVFQDPIPKSKIPFVDRLLGLGLTTEDLESKEEFCKDFFPLRGEDPFQHMVKLLDNLQLSWLYRLIYRRAPRQVFEGISTLGYLKHCGIHRLPCRELTYVAPGLFSGLPKLETLSLYDIGKGPYHDVLEGASSVLNLSVEGANRTTKFSLADLGRVPSLQKIELDYLRIALCPGFFATTPNITTLILKNLIIISLKPGVFLGLPHLEKLVLARCNLTKLKPGVFEGLPSLEILDLRWNALRYIEAKTFVDLPELREVSLEENYPLRFIAPGGFQGVPKLRHINIPKDEAVETSAICRPGFIKPSPPSHATAPKEDGVRGSLPIIIQSVGFRRVEYHEFFPETGEWKLLPRPYALDRGPPNPHELEALDAQSLMDPRQQVNL